MVDLTSYIENIPTVLHNDRIRANERFVYQFEPINIGNDHWEYIICELACFYYMCGYSEFYFMTKSMSDIDIIKSYYRTYAIRPLSLENPIKFFHSLIQVNMPKGDQQSFTHTMLSYALSGSGIAFGTAFDQTGVNSVRVVDLNYLVPIIQDMEIYRNLIRVQAELPCGYNFKREYTHYYAAMCDLCRQHEYICNWLKEWENDCANKTDRLPSNHPLPWSNNIVHWEEMFFSFLDFYENYCISQFPEDALHQRNTSKDCVEQLCLCARFIFKLEQIVVQLLGIRNIQDQKQNLTARNQWIDETKTFLKSDEACIQLQAMKESFPDDFLKLTETNYLWAYLLDNSPLSYNQRSLYPLLNKDSTFLNLNTREKQDLFWYRRHPVGLWIERLCRGPNKPSLRKIMPFYLSFYFIHKAKPLRPFTRFHSRFNPKKLPYTDKIAFSNHPNAIRIQNSHHEFYLNIKSWCKKYFPYEIHAGLNDALYTLHRAYLVPEKRLQKLSSLSNELDTIYNGLQRLFTFPVTMFPQYTDYSISTNEFMYFFYVDRSVQVKEIRKYLNKLITSELASEYKELAFLTPMGFGFSVHPVDWYEDIANWLSNIINGDKILSEYIKLDDKNLAQIELAIQFLCCERIKEEMSLAVLCYLKQLMAPN